MHRVLIIDDEPWSREVVKSLGQWEDLNLAVAGEAEDGTEGLGMIREIQPDIVITDMRMPGIEGVELLKAVNDQFPDIRIIVMSGYDDFVYLKQAIRSRAVEYLLKPVDPEELNSALGKCARELEQRQGKTHALWEASAAFADKERLDRYSSFRQQAGGYLRELNRPAVRQTLDHLRKFVETALREGENGNLLQRIGHDLMVILEEFLSENESGLEHLWNEKNSDWAAKADWKTIADVTDDIGWLYEKAIDAVENVLRNKNRLDLAAVRTYIDHHYQEAISLDTLAQRFFVSREHLSRVFKAYAGENISDYILKKRMEKARELIVEQKLAIKNVAQMMGYDDLAYFYKVFRKHFGLTPGEMRKEEE